MDLHVLQQFLGLTSIPFSFPATLDGKVTLPCFLMIDQGMIIVIPQNYNVISSLWPLEATAGHDGRKVCEVVRLNLEKGQISPSWNDTKIKFTMVNTQFVTKQAASLFRFDLLKYIWVLEQFSTVTRKH